MTQCLRIPTSDGSRLWLDYAPLPEREAREMCGRLLHGAVAWQPVGHVQQSARTELVQALEIMAGSEVSGPGEAVPFVVSSTPEGLETSAFRLHFSPSAGVQLEASGSVGVLYGVFALLRNLRLGRSHIPWQLREKPFFNRRMLNHWDNLDATFSKTGELVERGYAGGSLFDFIRGTTDLARIREYARALASIGINHVVLNNVNADPRVLEPSVLENVAAVAGALRSWGVRVWLSVNFASPIRLGGLNTADPLEAGVSAWWADKCTEIYGLIPDFGGFLVKASSEGEPGPHDYGREHHEGANMLARALEPHGGMCIWRAFVYGEMGGRNGVAFEHFRPLDGSFADNVILQIKHGPVDFLPNEPTSPLFGQMTQTRLGLELMITQEYTGQQRHLYYYGNLWERVLGFDTGAPDEADPTIAGICREAIAAVPNVGDERNWCGHPLAQANWYAYGRMAWNPHLGAREVAEEWTRLTFGSDSEVVRVITDLLMRSHDVYVGYTGPFGLCMLHGYDHFTPDPAMRKHVHNASPEGIGRDRTMKTGTGEVGHYLPPHRECYENPLTCPEDYLLYFHRVALDFEVDGQPIMEALCGRLLKSTAAVGGFLSQWAALHGKVPEPIYNEVLRRLRGQLQESENWARVLVGFFTDATSKSHHDTNETDNVSSPSALAV